jgi:dTDP-4-dehydrorhamnose 3,5-epimerase-like enzyme
VSETTTSTTTETIHSSPVVIGDDELDVPFRIEGLAFEHNLISPIDGPDGWFSAKLMSSHGPLVSDFVTHEPEFTYNTYGIHVGQVDRLTFMASDDRVITGHFVDCRSGSPTLHHKVSARYRSSLRRRLVVPRGVAHTFDGLGGVVTRDEPVWYADFANIDWDVNNDLVSIARATGQETYPTVRINVHRMPDALHRFVSQLSQSLLETPMAYASRHLLKIADKDVYVSFQSKRWSDDETEIQRLLDMPSVPGVQVRRSRYALTGPRSWTLVPNTGSCVSDVLVLPGWLEGTGHRFMHRRTRKWYTVLTRPGREVRFKFTDYRPGSPTFGVEYSYRTPADPRVSFAIDPGIAYSIAGEEELLIRCEHEVFVAPDEPRADLPAFGRDLIVLDDGESPQEHPALPMLRCPDEVVRQMARTEQEAIALMV